jgi:hypothetical protein|uniref:Uncharacterized protein n=1 Tax=Picea glauca TaxID=3330 RepID=A0A101M2G6_PICGL|nr:hypothetical protein ABT39_MTgene3058 [Picea glauca]QHR87273.1 hypothetical protein Q903MT_gene1283 [Picea sitchensis]
MGLSAETPPREFSKLTKFLIQSENQLPPLLFKLVLFPPLLPVPSQDDSPAVISSYLVSYPCL